MKKPILKIIGTDGNAFALLGKAKKVAEVNKMDWTKIHKEATEFDYSFLLTTLMKYFDVR
jgi:hypothetical protein